MKRIYLLLISTMLAISGGLQAQVMVGMEYFFNADPGTGNGTFVDFDDTDDLDLEYTFPLSGLTFGLHDLFIRVLDDQGNWSHTQRKQFLYFEGNTTSDIDGIEYFVDEDPGIGQALFVDLPDAPVINQAVNLDLSIFEAGFHILYIRVKDTNGSYSLAMAKPIFIADGPSNANTLSTLEYFFNEDPGYGNGIQVPLSNQSTIESEIDLAITGVEPGVHQLFIRVQNSFGSWSLTEQHQIVVFPGMGAPYNLVKVEYYFDEDPGFGQGYQVDVNASMIDTQLIFFVPEELSLGEHTMYVRTLDRQGRWSHYSTAEIFACPGGPAMAGFYPVRFGNTISFVDTASNVLSYFWDFGDGSTSTLSNPLHTFPFGEFTVMQVVANGCNSDTAYFEASIRGLESYTPNRAGLGGDIGMVIYGGGFDENTVVRLRQGGTVVNPSEQVAVSFSELNLFFDFHLIQNGGAYDLEVDIDGIDPIVIEDAVFLEEAIYPQCIATVEGPDIWRRNRNTIFELVIENTGNLNARGVPTYLLVPEEIEIEFLAEREYFRFDTLQPFMYYDSINAKMYDIEYSEVRDIIMGLRSDYLEIDTFNGMPYRARLYDVLVPNIPAGSSISIPFRALASAQDNYAIKVFSPSLNLFGSPATPQWLDMVENMGDMGLDAAYNLADESNNTWLQALAGTAKAGRDHMKLSAQYYGMRSTGMSSGEAFASVYGGGQLDAANAYALKTTGEIIADRGLQQLGNIDAAAISKLKGRTKNMAERILKTDDAGMRNMRQRMQDQFLSELGDITTESGRRDALWDLYKGINDVNDAGQYLTKTLQFLDDCPELSHLKDKILDEIDKMLNQEEEKTKDTRVIQSSDPNAIYGPTGFNSDYIRKGRNAHFIVAFENVDTATAPAQIVEVYDTLDLDVFDVSTFAFGHTIIAGELVRTESNRQQFVEEYDMRPAKDVLARINGYFDPATGVIFWRIMSLDPVTKELIDDPLEGFLNPNVNAPEGEGSVSYNVRLKPDLFHNTAYSNTGYIYFDDNEPIATNTWKNTVDDVKPVSAVTDDYRLVNERTVMLPVGGTDDGSGIKFYEVYISLDNAEFFPYTSTFGDSVMVEVGPDTVLYLYSIGVDSVGNKEVKSTADVSISLQPTLVVDNLLAHEKLSIFPNPATSDLSVRLTRAKAGSVRLELISVIGERVYESLGSGHSAQHQWNMDVRHYDPGIYILKLSDDAGKVIALDKIMIAGIR